MNGQHFQRSTSFSSSRQSHTKKGPKLIASILLLSSHELFLRHNAALTRTTSAHFLKEEERENTRDERERSTHAAEHRATGNGEMRRVHAEERGDQEKNSKHQHDDTADLAGLARKEALSIRHADLGHNEARVKVGRGVKSSLRVGEIGDRGLGKLRPNTLISSLLSPLRTHVNSGTIIP